MPDTHATMMHLVRIDAATFAITAFRVPAIAVVVGDGQIWSASNGLQRTTL